MCNPNKFSDNTTEEEITCIVKNNTNILLQAANALVTDKNETQVCAIKLLLDAGWQQTCITQRLVDEMKLKPLREINMEVSIFLSKKEGVMKLKEYKLNVKNMNSFSGKLIKCLCVPKICPNIKGQSVKQELKKRDFIKALKLADTSISPECSDIYWNFVTGETKRCSGENLVVVNSIFGFKFLFSLFFVVPQKVL